MDLYSGLPYWIIKNPLNNYFNPLAKDYTIDVVIIGSGITGSLVAHELCEAGIKCAIIDKRTLSTGSSAASTALLQYEIDVPLCEMVNMMEERLAVKAYEACLQSISDFEDVFKKVGYNPSFKNVSSIYYATDRKGLRMLKNEYEIRKKHKLPVTFLDNIHLSKKYKIDVMGALTNDRSAQTDTYLASSCLINHHIDKNELDVFSHTTIKKWKEEQDGYILETEEGCKIRCKHVIVAAGFEAGEFLPEKIMKLTSTYAIISQPVDKKYIWEERSLMWEARDPYLYLRTTDDNRIIIGGEDVEFHNPVARDKLLRGKVKILEKKFKKLMPHIPFVTDMAWCGTFRSTGDGLPFIGSWQGNDRMLYALGYGGNGITFSMIAAQMLRNRLKGVKDDREEVFSFSRLK